MVNAITSGETNLSHDILKNLILVTGQKFGDQADPRIGVFIEEVMSATHGSLGDESRYNTEAKKAEFEKNILQLKEAIAILEDQIKAQKENGNDSLKYQLYLLSALKLKLNKYNNTQDSYTFALPTNANLQDLTARDASLFNDRLLKDVIYEEYDLIHKTLKFLHTQKNILSIVSMYGSARMTTREVEDIAFLTALYGSIVMTGGGPSVMESGNRGAIHAELTLGDFLMSVGAAIYLDFEYPNDFVSRYESEETAHHMMPMFTHFYTRIMAVVYASDILVPNIGGFGTWHEVFAVISLMSTGEIPRKHIILYDNETDPNKKSYWKDHFETLNQLFADGLLPSWLKNYIFYADTPEEYKNVLLYAQEQIRREDSNMNLASKNNFSSHHDRMELSKELLQHDLDKIDALRSLDYKKTLSIIGPSKEYQDTFQDSGLDLIQKISADQFFEGATNFLVNSNGQFMKNIANASESLLNSAIIAVEGVHNSHVDYTPNDNLAHLKLYNSRMLMQGMSSFSNGIVLYPGNEHNFSFLYEVFCLIQTKNMPHIPIMLMRSESQKDYWDEMVKAVGAKLLQEKTISKNDLEIDFQKGLESGLFTITKSNEEVLSVLKRFEFSKKERNLRYKRDAEGNPIIREGIADDAKRRLHEIAKTFTDILQDYMSKAECQALVHKIVYENHETPYQHLTKAYENLAQSHLGDEGLEMLRDYFSYYGPSVEYKILISVLAKYKPELLTSPKVKLIESSQNRKGANQNYMGETYSELLKIQREFKQRGITPNADMLRERMRQNPRFAPKNPKSRFIPQKTRPFYDQGVALQMNAQRLMNSNLMKRTPMM